MMIRFESLGARPDLIPAVESAGQNAWPEFLHHGDVSNWRALYDRFPEYQFALLNDAGDVIGAGHTVPFRWDGEPNSLPETIDGIILRAIQTAESELLPNTISALAAIVSPEHQRQGHSGRILQNMRAIARDHGLISMVAPVRPILKSDHPDVSFDDYVSRTTSEGLPFDPWIRLHMKMGARILRTIPAGIRVEGSVAEWSSWTGMSFTDTGDYVVEGALQPVRIDKQTDLGVYEDPNVWMLHPL